MQLGVAWVNLPWLCCEEINTSGPIIVCQFHGTWRARGSFMMKLNYELIKASWTRRKTQLGVTTIRGQNVLVFPATYIYTNIRERFTQSKIPVTMCPMQMALSSSPPQLVLLRKLYLHIPPPGWRKLEHKLVPENSPGDYLTKFTTKNKLKWSQICSLDFIYFIYKEHHEWGKKSHH